MPRAVKNKSNAPVGVAPAKKAAAGGKKNKLYAMPEKIDEGTILTDLSKTQWRIGPSIGIGGFGEIYSACRVGGKNYDAVVKCEPHGNGPLFVEMHFYMRNAKLEDIENYKKQRGLKSLGMPYMIGNGSVDLKGQKHRFIVMPRYGRDVAEYFIKNGRRLLEGTVYRIALQMLDVYEFVHSCGYVHADLKAANILLGYGKGAGVQAYLVDYGLASHFTTKDFKPDPKKMHNGTIEYTSRDAHHGVATMRGDMEILGYNVIEWLGATLPWVAQKILSTPVKVQASKEEFMANVGANLKKLFPSGPPAPVAEFMKYIAGLEYNDVPNYDKCRKLFAGALKTMGVPLIGELELNLKTVTNNDELPSTSKGKYIKKKEVAVVESELPSTSKGRYIKKREVAVVESDSSASEVCASDDDDGDVMLIREPPIAKATPRKLLKTTPIKTPSKTPPRKATPLKPKTPKTASPLITKAGLLSSPRRRAHVAGNSSSSPSPSPPRKKRLNMTPSSSKVEVKANTAQHPSSRALRLTPQASSSQNARTTPLSAKAHKNFSSSGSLSRPGKTIINDSVTPNPRAVNVKRKKKAPPSKLASDHGSVNTEPATPDAGGKTNPVRVKVRKLAGDDDDDSVRSPRTPTVTVQKKSRRLL